MAPRGPNGVTPLLRSKPEGAQELVHGIAQRCVPAVYHEDRVLLRLGQLGCLALLDRGAQWCIRGSWVDRHVVGDAAQLSMVLRRGIFLDTDPVVPSK
jgi:hypothetical protein